MVTRLGWHCHRGARETRPPKGARLYGKGRVGYRRELGKRRGALLGGRSKICLSSLSASSAQLGGQQNAQEAEGNPGVTGRTRLCPAHPQGRGCDAVPSPRHPGPLLRGPPLQRGTRRCFCSLGHPAAPRVCGFPGVANKGVPFPSPAREINLDWILSCEGCPPPLCHYHNEMEVARWFNNISQERVSVWLRQAEDGERGGGKGQGRGCVLHGSWVSSSYWVQAG